MAAKKQSATQKPSAKKKTTASGRTASNGAKKNSSQKTAAKMQTARRTSAELAREEREHRNQMWAIILFALGILLTVLAFFEGSSGWKVCHDILRGLFGPISFGVGPCVIYLAVIITLGKESVSAEGKVWQTLVLLILLCGISQLFFGLPEGDTFLKKLLNFYQKGAQLKSGGLMAAILAWPLMRFAGGTVGAAVIQILLVFVFLMLISGSTLAGLFRSCAKPVKQLGESYNARREQREEAERARMSAIDIPIDGEDALMPEHPVFSPTQSFDKALEHFKEDPRELRRRKKEAKKLCVDPETGELEEKQETLADPVEKPTEKEPETSASIFTVDPERAPSEPVEKPIPKKPVNPNSLWSAPLPPSALAALDGKKEEEPLPFDPDEQEESYVDEAVFDALHDSILDEAAPSSDAFGAVASGGEATLDQKLDGAIKELEKPSSKAEAAKAADVRVGTPTPVEEIYHNPPVSLLKPPKNDGNVDVSEELRATAAKLVDTLKSFGVQTRVIAYSRGPTVTRYELQPLAGVKISKITGLSDDIALNLATAGVRIEAPIPNKPAVGIEVPNRKTDSVCIREIIDSDEFRAAKSPLSIALGKDIAGNVAVGDVASMPHLLIAGTTGSGKSVCVNSMIISMLYKSSPRDVRFILIDPKVVELGIYNGIPHLLIPVVTDPKKAAGALNWAVTEMLKRYKLFAENSVRDIKGYNRLAENSDTLDHMPHIVIIIDELADLMMAAPNEVEDSICRLAQMARAAGMHLIIATQRPSVDVVTGLIKANVPSRIALSVSSQVDSRTILDSGGAEKLLGRGDMLYYPMGFVKPVRVQGCYVSDGEIEAVVNFLKSGGAPVVYDSGIMDEIERQAAAEGKKKGGGSIDSDDAVDGLFEDAVQCVLDAGQCSTSYLQRRLKVGYARAARLVDELEDRGIVGQADGSKPREVLITKNQWSEFQMRNHMDD